jgi:hypothetical protein
MGKYDEDPDVLDQFPAQRLIFIATEWPPSRKQEWLNKWASSGGKLIKGQPVALKNDPVWRRINHRKTWQPPFDKEGMVDAEDVDRQAAQRLGLIKPTETLDLAAFRKSSPRRLTQSARKGRQKTSSSLGSLGCLIVVILVTLIVIGIVTTVTGN